MDQKNTFSEIAVSDPVFDSLKRMAFSGALAESVLNFTVRKGRESIRIKNYAGLLQTADGTQWEILPKIVQDNDPVTARTGLLKMLRSIPHLPFLHLTPARLDQARLPLWEIFITAFAEEMEKLTRQGIQKSYVVVEGEQPFLRGKWLPNRQDYVHPETLYAAYDEFQADILPNRLLKTCLLFLEPRSRSLSNQTRLRQLRFAWEEVGISTRLREDFAKVESLERRFDRYHKALQWAKVLLHQHTWAGGGSWENESLLFPTERLFENYVTQGFRRYLSDYEVFRQHSLHYLIDNHAGKKQFNLRPDLVLRKRKQTLVLDMKWKWIEPDLPGYGIEQSDLYQLYAYGRKYNADALLLIYPAHEGFRVPLPVFHYDDQLTLTVLPFNIVNPLAEEMEKINELLQTLLPGTS